MNRLTRALSIIGETEILRAKHPTDDHGFPLCMCEPCRAKSKRMNDAFIDAIAPRIGTPSGGGRDLDKEEAIANGEDLDVTTQQGQR